MLIGRYHLNSRAARFAEGGNFCSFGVTETIAATLVSVGVGAGTAAIAAPALLGAAGGAAVSGITGGDPLLGAAGGALTGGTIGAFGGDVGALTGLGPTAGDVLVGAGTGAAFNAATGKSPLMGALTGGASGLIAGLTAPDVATPGGVTPTQATADIAAAPATGTSGATGITAPAPPAVASSIGAQPFDLTQTVQLASAGPGLTATDAAVGAPGGGIAPSADTLSLTGGTGAPDAGGGTAPAPASGGADGGGSSIRFNAPPSIDMGAAGNIGISPNIDIGAAPTLPQAPLGSSIEPPLGSSLGPAPAAPAGAAGGSSPSFAGTASSVLKDLGVGAKTSDILGKSLGPALAGGGLLYSLVSPTTGATAGNTKQLQDTANALNTQGSQLVNNFLTTGSLPPGARAAVDQATNAAKAKVRSQFASMGLSGSTMESEALANVDSQAAAQVFNIGSSLMQTGMDQTKLASDLYTKLIGIDQNQSADTGRAIAAFAAALSGGGPTLRLAA